MDLQAKRFDWIEIVIALVLSTVLFWPFEKRYWKQLNLHSLSTAFHITMALVVLSIMWVATRFALRGLNIVIRLMPRLRRKIQTLAESARDSSPAAALSAAQTDCCLECPIWIQCPLR